MLEQSSKSKYQYKLRDLSIYSVCFTGTDTELFLRVTKFWLSTTLHPTELPAYSLLSTSWDFDLMLFCLPYIA